MAEFRFRRLTFFSFLNLCVTIGLFLGLSYGIGQCLLGLLGIQAPDINGRYPSVGQNLGLLVVAPISFALTGLWAGVVLYFPFNLYLKLSRGLELDDGLQAASSAKRQTFATLAKEPWTWIWAGAALVALIAYGSQLPRFWSEQRTLEHISAVVGGPVHYSRYEGLQGVAYVSRVKLPKCKLSRADVDELTVELQKLPRLWQVVTTDVEVDFALPEVPTGERRRIFPNLDLSEPESPNWDSERTLVVNYLNLDAPRRIARR